MKGLISSLLGSRIPAALAPLTLQVNGRVVTVSFKKNTRARRMTLRMERNGAGATMTVPGRVSRTEAAAFALRSTPWIEKQLAKQGPTVSFMDGGEFPLRGVSHRVISTGRLRGLVHHDAEQKSVHVPGQEHLGRRLRDWLKAQALADITRASENYATAMGVKFRRISMRDQKSRWGSCSAGGDLSYSWRLIFAPDFVLDYVAAHEVAHLREMNHGPRFWRLVLTHCPRTRDAKTWLKQHGAELHRLG